jgi:excisionase family DNA binding protein
MIGCDIANKVERSYPILLLDKLMKPWSIQDNLIKKPFLSPKELKDVLGISIPTIYRLIEKRKLPVYKVSNSLRFYKEDILAYLEKNRIDQITENI